MQLNLSDGVLLHLRMAELPLLLLLHSSERDVPGLGAAGLSIVAE